MVNEQNVIEGILRRSINDGGAVFDTGDRLPQLARAIASEVERAGDMPEELFDGYAVLNEIRQNGDASVLPLNRDGQARTVSEVLDAVVRLMKRRRARIPDIMYR